MQNFEPCQSFWNICHWLPQNTVAEQLQLSADHLSRGQMLGPERHGPAQRHLAHKTFKCNLSQAIVCHTNGHLLDQQQPAGSWSQVPGCMPNKQLKLLAVPFCLQGHILALNRPLSCRAHCRRHSQAQPRLCRSRHHTASSSQ